MNYSAAICHVYRSKYNSFHDGEKCVDEDDNNMGNNDEYFIDNVIV